MGAERNWSNEELEYLEDKWGVVSVGHISKTLKRTVDAIIVKKNRLGLGSFLDNGDYISYNQLLMALFGLDAQSAYRVNKGWVDFPVKSKVVKNCRFRIVYMEDFWKWAEGNKKRLISPKWKKIF